jgi:hypothetical protein
LPLVFLDRSLQLSFSLPQLVSCLPKFRGYGVAEYCLWSSSTAPCSSVALCLNLFLAGPNFRGMELLSIASGLPRPLPAAQLLFASTCFCSKLYFVCSCPSWPVDDAAAFVSSGEGVQHAAVFPSSSGDGFYQQLSQFCVERGSLLHSVCAMISL